MEPVKLVLLSFARLGDMGVPGVPGVPVLRATEAFEMVLPRRPEYLGGGVTACLGGIEFFFSNNFFQINIIVFQIYSYEA